MNKKYIISLIQKILSGSSSKEEEKEVNSTLYNSFISEKWDEDELGNKKEVQNRLEERVGKAIKEDGKLLNPQISNWVILFRVAAVITVFSFVVFFGWSYWQQKMQMDQLANNILKPGSDKAFLELNDGTVLSLEDMKVGDQYKNDYFLVKKTADGNLEYVHSENKSRRKSGDGWNTLKTPLGGKYQIVLADGTKAWLNAGSSLTFPESFSGKERLVKAKGEIYFEVSPDKTKPFIVNTNDLDIRVLGTSFIVSTYKEDYLYPSVSLIEGKVELSVDGHASNLVPGQKAIVRKQGLEIQPFDEESEVAWKNDYFIFKDRNIKEIMSSLGRWYDADIEYQGDDWIDKKFTVRISRRQDIREILSLIELTGSIEFKIVGRRVIVSR